MENLPQQPQIVTVPDPISPSTGKKIPKNIIVAGVLVFIAIIAGIYLLGRRGGPQSNFPGATSAAVVINDSYSLFFEKVSEAEVAVMLRPVGTLPNVLHLEVSYSPDSLRVLGITPGSIWQQANVLQTKIEDGQLIFDAGQGFGTQPTQSLEVARIRYLRQGQAKAEIRVLDGTRVGVVGVPDLIPVVGSSLSLE